jgi:predicted Rossmann fold nucleotide-binding protein DprA/Smf involved in DNA uptake
MSMDVVARVRAEIDERLAALRPAAEEHQRLLEAADALGLDLDAPVASARPARAKRSARRGAASGAGARRAAGASATRQPAAEQAIVAALEHGSHTVAELVVVTAMPGGEIRSSLRRLNGAGTVTRTQRAGRTAYALSRRA